MASADVRLQRPQKLLVDPILVKLLVERRLPRRGSQDPGHHDPPVLEELVLDLRAGEEGELEPEVGRVLDPLGNELVPEGGGGEAALGDVGGGLGRRPGGRADRGILGLETIK